MNFNPGLRPLPADDCVVVDSRKVALDHMLKALEHLDNDAGVPSLVAAQLQLSIDRLESSLPGISKGSSTG